jgi:hypothetical protein
MGIEVRAAASALRGAGMVRRAGAGVGGNGAGVVGGAGWTCTARGAWFDA